MKKKALNPLLQELSGGDLRSIGKSDIVVKKVLKDNNKVDQIIDGLSCEDPIIRMRSADVLEKISREIPEKLNSFKRAFIQRALKTTQQEVQWHLAQILPRLNLNKLEVKAFRNILKTWLDSDLKSKIVIVSAIQALYDLIDFDNESLHETKAIIKKEMAKGGPAVKSRGKKLLTMLKKRDF